MAISELGQMGEPDDVDDVDLEINPSMENEEETETRTESVVRDLILEEEPSQSESNKQDKLRDKQRKLKLEKKLEKERRSREIRLNKELRLGWPFTIKEIRLWVLLMCIVYFIKGMVEQYIIVIRPVLTVHLRHQEIEASFFIGLEEFGVLITLVLVSFYAGVIKKPWAIFGGVLVMFASNIFFSLPSFIVSDTMTLKGPAVTHVEASLCYPKDENTACDKQLKSSDKTMVFSLFCVSRILNGIGIGLVMPLGILYIYDNADKSRVAIFIGLVISSNGIGQFLGAVLGQTLPYTSLVMYGEPWVIVFILAACVLLVTSIFIPPFPTWFQAVPSYAKIRVPKVSLMAHKVKVWSTKKQLKGAAQTNRKVQKQRVNADNTDGMVLSGPPNAIQLSVTPASQADRSARMRTSSDEDDELEVSHVVFGNLASTRATGSTTPAPSVSSSLTTTTGVNSSTATPSVNSASRSVKSDKAAKKTPATSGESAKETESSDRSFNIRNFSYFLLRQLKDPVFVLMSVAFSLVSILFRGYYFTLAKFMELQFLAPSHADPNIIAGICIPLATSVGVIGGAVIIWKFERSQRRLVLLAVITTAVAALGFFILMAFKCHDTLLDAENHSIGKDDLSPESCGMECSCRKAVLVPVCHVGGNVTYESPCHAGCHVETPDIWTDNYIQCSCGERIQLGVCGLSESCKSLIPLSLIITILVMVASLIIVPVIMIVIRNAKPREKYISLGFFWWLVHVIGHLLGPVIFGAILNSCCLLWKELGSCTEQEDICWNYDLNKLRLLHNGIMGCILAVAAGCFVGVYVYLRYKKRKEASRKDAENGKADVDQNDNVNVISSDKTDNSDGVSQDTNVQNKNEEMFINEMPDRTNMDNIPHLAENEPHHNDISHNEINGNVLKDAKIDGDVSDKEADNDNSDKEADNDDKNSDKEADNDDKNSGSPPPYTHINKVYEADSEAAVY